MILDSPTIAREEVFATAVPAVLQAWAYAGQLQRQRDGVRNRATSLSPANGSGAKSGANRLETATGHWHPGQLPQGRKGNGNGRCAADAQDEELTSRMPEGREDQHHRASREERQCTDPAASKMGRQHANEDQGQGEDDGQLHAD